MSVRLRAVFASARRIVLATVIGVAALSTALSGQGQPSFEIEIEGGAVWQSRNDVQVPNDLLGTRFSLVKTIGNGPWPAARMTLTWNVAEHHGVRVLLAPLSVSGSGTLTAPVDFAGESFAAGADVSGTYQFNSYRLTYRYLFSQRERLDLRIGFTVKVRDAKIELQEATLTARDTDVGFVPLLHLAADWKLAARAHLSFDLDGLAGGPGRAFDGALKAGYDVAPRWRVSGGYRTVEGGADVPAVFAFAWLHYGVVGVRYAF